MIPEDRFEQELKNALRRESAPEGFAGRVLARIERSQAESLWSRLRAYVVLPKFRAAMALLLMLVVVGGIFEYRRIERERAAGEAARNQLLLALHITGSKLQYAQDKINSLGSERNPQLRREQESLQ
jgi:hypothetical protein